MKRQFPSGFLWGASTSAHQVEGNNTNSDWWRSEQLGRVPYRSGNACEQYVRYETDFDLVVELGHNAHRLSVEWARIEPEAGALDRQAIEHYVDVLRALKARGLTTYVTLHHFTNPLWFAQRGGWSRSDSPALFARYVEGISAHLAPYVDFWLTFNEPTAVPYMGYLTGSWPPHKRLRLRSALRAIDMQARAHRLAYGHIHRMVPEAQVGYSCAFINWRPIDDQSTIHRTLANAARRVANYRFSDRVAGETDLIGVQYYFTLPVGWWFHQPGSLDGVEKSDLGWDIVPEGLHDVVMDVWNRYGRPIHVTENGLADAEDTRRADFIRAHLVELHRAVAAGADVRGYLYWSLLDNFEWAFGFAPRFGLIEVDYDSQNRTIRESARVYADIVNHNGLEEG